MLAEILDPKWVLWHRGSTKDYLARYRRLAAQAAAEKLPGLRAIAPSLLTLISDERTLFTAWTYMSENGGEAPGPDGATYDQFNLPEVWRWCRAERDTIREGFYTPGDERVHRIPKSSGRGFRELVLQSVFDRAVHRAAVEVLQPLLDPHFDPLSFGYRPMGGPLRALATAEHLSRDRGPGVWVSVDVRDAFSSVPLGRLLGVLRKYLPADDLISFVEVMIRSEKVTGLRQGSPASPLLLNFFLHHMLDRRWRTLHPDVPLLRFADDILLLCRTGESASAAYASLVKLLGDAGMAVKESEADAVSVLTGGDAARWMGFEIRSGKGGLRFGVTADAWAKLSEKFAVAHLKPNSPLWACTSLAGWIADKAPCYPSTDVVRAYSRIRRLAQAQGFEEILDRDEVVGLWQRAYARWCRLRKNVAATG